LGPSSRGLTQEGFDRLLRVLDDDREQAGERYEQLRRRLLLFFRARGVPQPEDRADDTLTVAAARMDKGEVVENVEAYTLGIARLIALEGYRADAQEREALRESALVTTAPADAPEERHQLFERCLAQLPGDQRDLILAYYGGPDGDRIAHRRRLAEQHAIPVNALRIRAHRIRQQLERALHGALEGGR
jgi:DNA-directed RNA polymerase specialized sigma24 family protein